MYSLKIDKDILHNGYQEDPMIRVHCVIFPLVHVLDQQEQVVLSVRVDGVTDSGQVGAGVGSAEWFSYTPDHLRKPEQVRLLHPKAQDVPPFSSQMHLLIA